MPATEGALRRSALGRRFRGCRTDDGTMVRSTLVFVVLVAAAACTPSTQSESATSCATEATIVVDPMEYSLDAEELGQFDGLALVVLTFDSVEAADNRSAHSPTRIRMSSSRWRSFVACLIRRDFCLRSSPTSNETARSVG